MLDVKEYTNVEGPTNCKAATSTTRQCNNNDNTNNIKERLVWSGQKRRGMLKLVINLTLVSKVTRWKKIETVLIDLEILMCMFEIQIPPRGHLPEA